MFTKSLQPTPQAEESFRPSVLHDAEARMNREKTLTPRMVSSLLNVSVLLNNEHIYENEVAAESSPVLKVVFIIISAAVIATVSGAVLLHVNEIDPFGRAAVTAVTPGT